MGEEGGEEGGEGGEGRGRRGGRGWGGKEGGEEWRGGKEGGKEWRGEEGEGEGEWWLKFMGNVTCQVNSERGSLQCSIDIGETAHLLSFLHRDIHIKTLPS